MNSANIKTPEQVEFTDLFNALKELGYNQTRISQVCKVSKSMVSQILKGGKSPRQPSLELLRKEHERVTGHPESGAPTSESDTLREQLSFLEKHDPSAFAAAQATVNALHKQSVGSVNYDRGPRAEKRRAIAIAEKRLARQGKQPGSPGRPTTDRTGLTSHGTSEHPTGRLPAKPSPGPS